MTTHPAAGTYFPAATRNDDLLTNLTVHGLVVRADVDVDGGFTVYAGDETVSTGMLNGSEGDLMVFFTGEALVWSYGVEQDKNEQSDADLAAVIEHVDAVETVSDAVAEIREQGAAMLIQADWLQAQGTEPVRFPRMIDGEQRGFFTWRASDPRHPSRRYAAVRRNGERLAAWTQADEDAYGQYVSDGLADTDGWFAPMTREAWAITAV
jgi:hypothetical protein